MPRRLVEALGVPEETRRELEDRLAALRIEVRAARLLLRQGAGTVQLQIGQREAHATSVWSYHPRPRPRASGLSRVGCHEPPRGRRIENLDA
jgi:hypothetical protein